MSMANHYFAGIHQKRAGLLSATLCSLLLAVTGCNPDKDDGKVINNTALPTDTRLNLQCEDVGIFTETCVLDDPNNPFRTSPIKEFDVNNPDADTKFDQLEDLNLPDGPTGAKARFYFWATALARRANGENQYYTALALHELYTAGIVVGGNNDPDDGSPNAREQAKKAYRSVLDNFFGALTFFTTCDFLNPPCEEDDPREVTYPVIVSDLTGQNLYDPSGLGGAAYPGGYATLFPDDDADSGFLALETIGEWGFAYDIDNQLVFVGSF
jgi:hypothetical protein